MLQRNLGTGWIIGHKNSVLGDAVPLLMKKGVDIHGQISWQNDQSFFALAWLALTDLTQILTDWRLNLV